MSQTSEIEWTDATWNPVTGCTKIGPGCDNCYAERFAERWRGIEEHPYQQGFDLRLWPARLAHPAQWKKPRMIFVNSMSYLFRREACYQLPHPLAAALGDAVEQEPEAQFGSDGPGIKQQGQFHSGQQWGGVFENGLDFAKPRLEPLGQAVQPIRRGILEAYASSAAFLASSKG